VSEPNWLRRFIVANLNLWERGDKRGAAVADIATATGSAVGDVTAELELMRAEGLARRGDDERWHPEVPDGC
jgi:hypothetical protein